MLENLEVGDLVAATWIDSGLSIHSGWESPRDIQARIGSGGLEASTVGYYLGQAREDVILIAQSWDIGNDGYMNAQAIYLPCLRGIVKLGVAGAAG